MFYQTYVSLKTKSMDILNVQAQHNICITHNIMYTCTQMRNFLIRDGVNLAKWLAKFCGVATLASKMYTSPATPTCSSFNLMSPIINTTFIPSATVAAICSKSTPLIMTTRRPFGVKPGSGGTFLKHDETENMNDEMLIQLVYNMNITNSSAPSYMRVSNEPTLSKYTE